LAGHVEKIVWLFVDPPLIGMFVAHNGVFK
jgi:hypothetical protein